MVIALYSVGLYAQTAFHSYGTIQYEVRQNVHKSLGTGMWADMWKDKVPRIGISYYSLNFSPQQSLYKFESMDPKYKLPWSRDFESDNIWFTNFADKNTLYQKNIFGDVHLLSDTLKNMQWKISDKIRDIQGYQCRKATAILYDSVYVFVFYTDEIMVSGGPMSLQGLPGMILAVTIPRMNTTWMATSVKLTSSKPPGIDPPKKGRKNTVENIRAKLENALKDWGSYGTQRIWEAFL